MTLGAGDVIRLVEAGQPVRAVRIVRTAGHVVAVESVAAVLGMDPVIRNNLARLAVGTSLSLADLRRWLDGRAPEADLVAELAAENVAWCPGRNRWRSTDQRCPIDHCSPAATLATT